MSGRGVPGTPEKAKMPLRKRLRSGYFLWPDSEKALKSRAFGQNEKVGNFYQNYLPFVVEARGVEPLSENASKGASPGADDCCGSLSPCSPRRGPKRQARASGSFIVHGALKALRTHVRLSSTPRIRAEALPEGTGHGLGRGQNSSVVVL